MSLWERQNGTPVPEVHVFWYSGAAYLITLPDKDIWAHSGTVQLDRSPDETLDKLKTVIDYMCDLNIPLTRLASFGPGAEFLQTDSLTPWSRQEKIALMELRERHLLYFVDIEPIMHPREAVGIEQTYKQLKRDGQREDQSWYEWPEEDEDRLLDFVNQALPGKPDWEQVAVHFPGRSWEACCAKCEHMASLPLQLPPHLRPRAD